MTGPVSDTRLDRAVQLLWDAQDLKRVVAVVEVWAQSGNPSLQSRLLQVQALGRLGMTERALTRLLAISSREARTSDQFFLAATLFLARGWTTRASEAIDALEALDPSYTKLHQLREALAAPPAAPPDDPLPLAADHDAQIATARAYLSQGSFVRARHLLEAMLHRDPTDTQASDLIWALQGDYRIRDESLDEIVSRLEQSAPAAQESDPEAVAIDDEIPTLVDLPDPDALIASPPANPTAPPIVDEDTFEEQTAVMRVFFEHDPPAAPKPAEPRWSIKQSGLEAEDDEIVVLVHGDTEKHLHTQRRMPNTPDPRRANPKRAAPKVEDLPDQDIEEIAQEPEALTLWQHISQAFQGLPADQQRRLSLVLLPVALGFTLLFGGLVALTLWLSLHFA